MMQGKEKIAPVPGLLATIAAGFDLTAKHFWLTLIPVLLDSFFWLGPRLSIRPIVERAVDTWQPEALVTGMNLDVLLDIAPRTNLLTNLSVPLIGVPTLMAGLTPEKTPISVQVTELDNVWLWLFLLIAFSLVGLLLTSIFWNLAATVVKDQPEKQVFNPISISFIKSIAYSWLKLFALAFILIIVALMIYFPLVLISLVVSLFSQIIASAILLIAPVLLIWLSIYLWFTPYGIIVNGRPLGQSLLESMRLMRRFMATNLVLILVVLLIGQGLEAVLLLADDGSWLTWASIWGHAFVRTALLVAMIIYYRDRFDRLLAEAKITERK